MSYCEDSNINKSYIVQSVDSADIFSACTEIYLTNITPCTGDTININSNLSVIGDISGTTYYGDGSQLSGIITTDNYVTGGVYTASTKSLYFTGTTGFTPFSIDVSALLDDTNNYVTGGTYNPSTDIISLFRNDDVTIDITGVTDTFTTGGTYDNGTSLITFIKNDNTSYTVDLSSIDVNDTFVTGSTLNGDSLTIRRNDGLDIVVTGFSQTFTGNTSGTCIGDIYVSNIHSCSPLRINSNDEGNVYFGSTSGVTIDVLNQRVGIGTNTPTEELEVNGNTKIIGTVNIGKLGTGSPINNLGIDSNGNVVVGTTGDTDTNTFVTGGTLSGDDLVLEKNNGVDVNPIDLSGLVSGKTDLTLFNSHTGDTNNPHDTSFTNLTSTAHTHTLSEITDFNSYSGDVQTQIDSKTDLTLFDTHTGDTSNPHQTSFSNLTSTAHTHTISEVINLQTELDNKLDATTFNTYSGSVETELNTKISGATNLSSEGIFVQKNGLDLEFKGLISTGGTVNISSNSSSVNLEVTFPTDQDKFVSGGTYNGGSKEINFVGNSSETTFDVDLTPLVSSVSANTYVIDGVYIDSTDTLSLLRNDGNFVNITGITDTFTTGGTYDNNTALLSFTKNDSTIYDVDMTSLPLVDDITLEIDSNNDIRLKDFVGSPTGGTRTFDGQIIITSGLTLSALGTGTSINNLGIDINGNIVIGTTGGTDTNTYVTGFTFNPSTYDLTIKQNDGQPDLTSNLAVLATDVYVVSGVYNPATGIVTYINSSGGTFQVSGFTTGMTDSYTTAANLNGETIEFDNNIQGSNLYSVNLSPVLSGKTNNTDFISHTGDTSIHFTKSSINLSDLGNTAHTHTISEIINLQTELDSKTDLSLFNSHTGDTNNPHQTSFTNLTNTAHTHTLSEITDFNTYSGNVQTQLDTKIGNGINSGGANEVFSGKSGTDLYFRTISGGSNTTITTIDDIIKVDVSVPVGTNTFVTGFTYDNVNTFTISRNGGLGDLTSTISVLSGITYYGDGSNLSGISSSDFYVTGGTFSAETLTLDRNDGGSVVVTGFTSQPSLNNGEIFVGDTGNTAQSVAMTGDVNIDNTGVTTIQPDSVTYDKIQDVSQAAILGSSNTSGGTVTEIPTIDLYLTTGSITTLLENTSNWDINGNYTGGTITGTYQGQNHYDGNYFFTAVDDNVWIRLIRG